MSSSVKLFYLHCCHSKPVFIYFLFIFSSHTNGVLNNVFSFYITNYALTRNFQGSKRTKSFYKRSPSCALYSKFSETIQQLFCEEQIDIYSLKITYSLKILYCAAETKISLNNCLALENLYKAHKSQQTLPSHKKGMKGQYPFKMY